MNPGIRFWNLMMAIIILSTLCAMFYVPAMRGAIKYVTHDKNIKQHTDIIKGESK